MPAKPTRASPFGQLLRQWRNARGFSQLQLALRANTTSRHLSFVETGRSRPGRDLILRLASCLDLPLREQNRLLACAGLSEAFPERQLDDAPMFRVSAELRAMLERHDPYPGSVIDVRGKVHFANRTFRRLLPDAESLSAEESIDAFYGTHGPTYCENWAEVGWALVDLRFRQATAQGDPELNALAERAERHMDGVARTGQELSENDSPVICMRTRVGDRIVSTYSAALRFDTARDVTLSELRLELVFPADERSADFFRALDLNKEGGAGDHEQSD